MTEDTVSATVRLASNGGNNVRRVVELSLHDPPQPRLVRSERIGRARRVGDAELTGISRLAQNVNTGSRASTLSPQAMSAGHIITAMDAGKSRAE